MTPTNLLRARTPVDQKPCSTDAMVSDGVLDPKTTAPAGPGPTGAPSPSLKRVLAVENVEADLGRAVEAAAPARSDIICVVPEDIVVELVVDLVLGDPGDRD